MVQFFKGGEEPQSATNQLIGSALGHGLGTGLNTYFASRALDSVLKDKSLEGAPTSKKLGKLQSALMPYGETGQKIFQNRLAIDQEEMQEQEQDILGRVLADKKVSEKEIAKLRPEHQFKVQELQKRRNAGRSVKESLIKAGYPEETAQLWQNQIENSPIGGQSDVIKNVNDLIRRSKPGKGIQGNEENTSQTKPSIEIPGVANETFDLDFPELPEPIGLTPADVVKQNEHREKTNVPVYTETVDRLNALDEEYRDVSYLQELNNVPGALPTGFQKWNVDWDSGDLRAKALATPETQAYVKTIARMARKAKEFFPGRVTNFDLEQFKQGFPTLANNPEGRELIAEQLSLANRIAYLKDETLKAAYDHYGSGSDPILVKKYATQNYRRLKNDLENRLKSVNERAASLSGSEKVPIENASTVDELFPL